MQSMYLPRRRRQEIAVELVGEETLVYDERRNEAFCLDPLSSAVWRGCDGGHSAEQIGREATLALGRLVSAEAVHLLLEELERRELLEADSGSGGGDEVSRRELMRRLGTSAALMLPAIACVSAPSAAQAYTGCVDCSSAHGARVRAAERRSEAEHLPASPSGLDQ